MPQILYDGDFTVAQIAGSPEFSIPFATDPKPYLYKLKYWQFLNNFVEPALGELGPLGGGYVGGSPGTFKSIGGGVIEFEREYARVPDTRNEYESFVAEFYFSYFSFGFATLCTNTLPLSTTTRVQFDYFATDDPNSIDVPRKPALVDSGCFGILAIGGFADFVGMAEGTEFLCEDAALKIWKPGIYERKQRFARWLTGANILEIE